MTKKHLLTLLEGVPDNALIVTPGNDHSYRKATVTPTTAIIEMDAWISEDHGEGLEPAEARINVVLIE